MPIERSRFAVTPVVAAMAALALVLAVTATAYGYHRDELYFRMLDPVWGYVDQPPLTPLIATAAAAIFGDTVVAGRIMSGLFAIASVVILTLITREVGGGRLAQALTAWGMAGASMTLAFGHVLLTASLDLVIWPAALLFALRATLRDDGRWWFAVGAIVGISALNKLLIVTLLVGIATGLAVLGPRRWLRSGWLWGAVALCAVLALPSILYQALNGWPQLAMGAALGENNADEVRIMMWPFLILMVGPVLAIWWVVALISLFCRPEWRPIRWISVTFAVMVVFVFAAGAQFYYTFGVLSVLVAIGSASVADWARTRGRRTFLFAAIAINSIGCALTSLPLLPVEAFGASGLAAVNASSADQVGWERYVEQIETAVGDSEADAIITANYGEAGALDRFGVDLPPITSGHNALWDAGPPPRDATTVVVVGDFGPALEARFETCTVVGVLENGVGVENEEQGVPIRVCTNPVASWVELWPQFRHLD
ncbi:ArnT family glycosyltransferase [Microbacterium sp. Leaf320]|uniref:ArnT family glycosyltransferase n=1 Tax=Microbacterium sp. Leaf320 TaxID=1736334 RepID=UPI00070157DC|nr:glycosyltransferase family 39 protein [Microbacterium sp. Leaf320]KQQ67154.1 hypothetical protein ASF63_08015 [Microbacterium sp. Leaf320]